MTQEERRVAYEALKRMDRRDGMVLGWLAGLADGAWTSAADAGLELHWTLGTTTCVLSKLRNLGLAETTSMIGRQRRYYRITELGHEVLRIRPLLAAPPRAA